MYIRRGEGVLERVQVRTGGGEAESKGFYCMRTLWMVPLLIIDYPSNMVFKSTSHKLRSLGY